MELDLRNWSERQTYFLGRFYDLPTQLLVMRLLRRGDLFVDVGANIGMISALAAHCVGTEGRVLAFEPNPDAMRRLRRLIETNDLADRIAALPMALSDAEGTMTLSVITEHTSATLLETLAGLGYEAHDLSRRMGLRHGLQLSPIGAQDLPVRSDVLFLPEDSPLRRCACRGTLRSHVHDRPAREVPGRGREATALESSTAVPIIGFASTRQ